MDRTRRSAGSDNQSFCIVIAVVALQVFDLAIQLEENVGGDNAGWLKSALVLTIHPRIQEHLFEEGFKNVELVESRCSGLADKLISLAE